MKHTVNCLSTQQVPKHTQVLVIGGGPSGSSVSTLLAKQGFDVTLLEKEVFPRYHIGESLLPTALTFFDLLGVREDIENYGFKRKQGSYLEWGKDSWLVDFSVLGKNQTYSFQVKREEFDHLLLKHSSKTGVKVFEGVAVEKVIFDDGRPKKLQWNNQSDGQSGEISFDYLVDASGRRGIIATKYQKDRKFYEPFQNAALWGYWRNIELPEKVPSGAISVISTPLGWFWGIPLHDGTMSIGIVMHKSELKKQIANKDLKDIYHDAIKQSPYMQKLIGNAQFAGEILTEQDYSYSSASFCGPGYFICGDAACFIDPLLSSGVHLAMFSALLASASISSIIRGEVSENEAINFYQKCYNKAYVRLLVFVSSFYNQYEGMESHFWQAKKLINSDVNQHDLKYAFTSLISGVEDIKDVETEMSDFIFNEMLNKVKEKTSNARKVQDYKTEGKLEAIETMDSSNSNFFSLDIEGLFPLKEAEAIDGLYVSVKNGVRLSRLKQSI